MPQSNINPNFETAVEQLRSLIDDNDEVYSSLRDKLIDFGLADSSGFLSKQSLAQLLQYVIFPTHFSYGVGWQEASEDLVALEGLRGSMNGVTEELLELYFDLVFVDTNHPQVVPIAQQINQFSWRGSEELKRQLLHSLCLSYSISGLLYVALAGSSACNYPLRVMTADPCAGYLLAQLAFETYPQNGSYFVTSNLQDVPTPGGDAGLFFPEQFASIWIGAGEQISQGEGASYTVNALNKRDQWLLSSTSPVDSNPLGIYQDVWRSRLLADADGQLGTIVKINEQFNLNNRGYFTLEDSSEVDALKLIGESYVRVLKAAGIDYDTLAQGVSVELPDPTSSGGFTPSGNSQEPNATATSSPSPSNSSSGGDLDQLLSLKTGNSGKVNNYGGSQVLINSDRIILNSRTDYLMLFGGAGISIASPNPVNIESDAAITMFGEEGVYIGLPNKGEVYEVAKIKPPKNKAQATPDQEYEPLVLGDKLFDILEDLLLTIRNATILTPTGAGYLNKTTLDELAQLQARLPEIKSTYAFIDGISHEQPDPEPASTSTPETTKKSSSQEGLAIAPNPVDNATGSELNDFYNTRVLYEDPLT